MSRWIFLLFLLVLVVACGPRQNTELEYAPQMYRSPAYKAQEYDGSAPQLSVMRKPPQGTVPIGYTPYTLTLADSLLQDQMTNPLPMTAEVLQVGRKYYNIYCIVCHGPKGDGMGYVVPKGMQQPPSFITGQTTRWSDGRIFHLITRGRGNMASYASQLLPDQRWAIVHYVRALQRAGKPTEKDLQELEKRGITFTEDVPDTSVSTSVPKQ
ncbi:MAG: cytochrome c [bacterium]|nr:cytochrome c [bacterium]